MQVYLEPGEAAITRAATLEVTVLDTLDNGERAQGRLDLLQVPEILDFDVKDKLLESRTAIPPRRVPRWEW